jgi:cyclophilin family peptidyl-prolyl cis-trans isomerase
VTLAPDAQLDKTNLVFGRVLEGEEVVRRVSEVPVSREDYISSKSLFAAAGKGFDPRAKIIYLNKPLQKVVVKQAGRA